MFGTVKMIRYTLICDNDHEFDGWFRDSATCGTQLAAGDVRCPVCGSWSVGKALMAPNVVSSRVRDAGRLAPPAAGGAAPAAPSPPPAVPAVVAPAAAPVDGALATKMAETLAALRKRVEETCENVGADFAEEARRIHYGEGVERPIYGEASLEEARDLDEEGIAVALLPWSRRAGH
ncbi:hypothetical protein CKO38_09945 [Rhodospirillum rubrum]|nr:hypothetical protein [Rhodospirillum rubrum]MBK1676982.1 hypothetical protein [Rhodospirillum rubrum]